jgi:hypothetical protein
MNALAKKIQNAVSTEELEMIVREMPKQENGHRSKLASILGDTFWYIDLDTVEKQKAFMLVRVNSGIFSTK